MISTKSSPLKYVADFLGINKKFSKRRHNIIDNNSKNIVSPVEATLLYHGNIDEQGYILSKHRKKITLDKLIGKYADTFQDGTYINFYLAPRDNHNFVLPYKGTIEYIQKNEGKASIPIMIGLDNIFSMIGLNNIFDNQYWFSKAVKRNASIGIIINSQKFSYAMIAVGSLNVNNISVECEVGKKYHKGVYAGRFSIGSTIILCFDKSFKDNSEMLIKNGEQTKIGEPIIKI